MDCQKFLVTILFLFLFFSFYYTLTSRGIVVKKWQEIISELGLISQIEQSKISRHYFVFCFFLFSFAKSNLFPERTVENFSSLFCFFFFFLLLTLYSYLARDSSKKWQEILNKLGLISQIVQLQNFLSLLCFLFKNEMIKDPLSNLIRPFYCPLVWKRAFLRGISQIRSKPILFSFHVLFCKRISTLCVIYIYTFCLYSQWNGTISRVHVHFFFSLAKSTPLPETEASRKFFVTILFFFSFSFFFLLILCSLGVVPKVTR